jgi:hypothetical protein
VVLGFLGSGKTTLVNNMLRNPGGRRIAVVENEFGSVSVDHELLRSGLLCMPLVHFCVLICFICLCVRMPVYPLKRLQRL